jgi:hypothetical protein
MNLTIEKTDEIDLDLDVPMLRAPQIDVRELPDVKGYITIGCETTKLCTDGCNTTTVYC